MPKKKKSTTNEIQKRKSAKILKQQKKKKNKRQAQVLKMERPKNHDSKAANNDLNPLIWLIGSAHWFSSENEYWLREACKNFMKWLLPDYVKPKARKGKTEDETIDLLTIGKLTEYLFGKLKDNGKGEMVRKGGYLNASDDLFNLLWRFVEMRNDFTHHFHGANRSNVGNPKGQ